MIFNQILSDLEEAIAYLPYPGQTKATSRTDRVNKVFAEGLYARIALLASGYAIRPDDGMVGTGDLGTVRLSIDSNLQKSVLYPKALSSLKDAISSGTARLEPDFENYWYKLNNMANLDAGPAFETLYVIPFGAGRGRWNFTFAISSEGASISNGVSRGGDAGPVPTMYFKYGENDQRRDVTCVNYKWNKDDSIEPAVIAKWYFGKYRFEWMDAQPYSGGNDDGIKPVVMRYADILLMAAEIANEQGDLSYAKNCLRQVRERAYIDNEDEADAYVNAIGSKEEMFNAIVDERALEFCGEFLRKADLIRWNLLKSRLDEAADDMLALRDLQGDICYTIAADEKSIDITFLSYGDEIPAGAEVSTGYVNKYDDGKKSGFYYDRIKGIYYRNPEQYMFWPIFNDTITNSQGYIKNDYGYESI